jgi:hypothetical protein
MSDDQPKSNSESNALILKGRRIREDANGLLCLNDIYVAARRPKNQSPGQWYRLPSVPKLVMALYEKTVGFSPSKGKIRISSIYYAKGGRDGGTYAHPILAAAYAAHLSPKLAIEIKEVWLRYRAGDPTLADEILERASSEDNRWVAARAMSRIQRRRFTDVLKAANVTRLGYALCTDAIYLKLFNRNARQIKQSRDALVTRDAMDVVELAQITLSEGMASERIEEERRQGDQECQRASTIAASYIREAVEKERASRRPRLDL